MPSLVPGDQATGLQRERWPAPAVPLGRGHRAAGAQGTREPEPSARPVARLDWALRRALRPRRTHHAALGLPDVPHVVPADMPRQQLAEKRHARTRWLWPPDSGFPSLGHGLLI